MARLTTGGNGNVNEKYKGMMFNKAPTAGTPVSGGYEQYNGPMMNTRVKAVIAPNKKPVSGADMFRSPSRNGVTQVAPRPATNSPAPVNLGPRSTETPGSNTGFTVNKTPMPVIKRAPQPGMQPIDPNNSLRGQQIGPTGTGPNSYDQQALDALGQVQGGNVQNSYDQQAKDMLGNAKVSTEFDAQTQATRDQIMQSLQNLQGPDRQQLAMDAYGLFQEQTNPQYQQDLRDVGKKAGALGRVGAGMTTNDLTGVMGQRQQQQNWMQRDLINNAAQQQLGDRRDILNSQMGASGLLNDQTFQRENANAGYAMQGAGMLGQFGQNQFNRENANANLGMQKAGAYGDMGNNQFGREVTAQGQQTQQQAYQDQLAQQALNNRQNQNAQEQQQAQMAWQRQMAEDQMRQSIASGYQSPVGAYQNAGQQGGGMSSSSMGAAAGYGSPVQPQYQQAPQQPPPQVTGIGMQNAGQGYDTGIFSGQGLGMQDPRYGRAI